MTLNGTVSATAFLLGADAAGSLFSSPQFSAAMAAGLKPGAIVSRLGRRDRQFGRRPPSIFKEGLVALHRPALRGAGRPVPRCGVGDVRSALPGIVMQAVELTFGTLAAGGWRIAADW